ncbi:MAG: hypothetical protein E6Q97_38110 [Desulfurellales bacterium]|nr:MAG: hypothetical protein E6Q97_38110 [Desulfurellales bacterium]
MSISATPIIPRDGVLTIKDGAGTPLSYAIPYSDGDFSLSGLVEDQTTVQSFRNRGRTYAIRKVEDQDLEFSFTCHAHAILGDGATAGLYDVLGKKGVWAAATSTLPAAAGDAFCVSLTFTAERSNLGATSDASVVLKYCRISGDFQEGVPSTFSISGTAYAYSTDYLTIT